MSLEKYRNNGLNNPLVRLMEKRLQKNQINM
jgi:hypothetical protein